MTGVRPDGAGRRFAAVCGGTSRRGHSITWTRLSFRWRVRGFRLAFRGPADLGRVGVDLLTAAGVGFVCDLIERGADRPSR